LDEDDYVRELVVESVVNGGLESIATAAGEMRQARPGTFEHDWLTTCRRAVVRVFGTPAAVPAQSRRTGRRALAGVAS
jgi:hypothetical protein